MNTLLGKHFRVDAQAWNDSFLLYGTKVEIDPGNNIYGFKAIIEWVPKEEGALVEPFTSLTNSEAQELIDTLWRAGMRPTEGKGSAGQLTATVKHLEDMRVLSTKLIDKVLNANN